MKYYVYRHVRLDKDEPFYIGIGTKENYYTSYETEYKRAYSCKRSVFWTKVVNKSDCEVQIVYESDSYEEIKLKEIEFIRLYGRRDLGLGSLVNLTNGGDGHDLGNIQIVVLNLAGSYLFTCKSIKEASRKTGVKTGNICSICKKRQKARKYIFVYKYEYEGENNYADMKYCGPVMTMERRIEIVSKINYSIRAIQMYSLSGEPICEFSSIKEACLFLGITIKSTGITTCCKGVCRSYKGYRWKYKNKI